MNYFSNQEMDEGERRDVAFQLVNALREVVSISKKLKKQKTNFGFCKV